MSTIDISIIHCRHATPTNATIVNNTVVAIVLEFQLLQMIDFLVFSSKHKRCCIEGHALRLRFVWEMSLSLLLPIDVLALP
jgi:hypothetical protein